MYKQTSQKKTDKGISIRLGDASIPFQSVSVYQHFQETKNHSETMDECDDLAAEVISKLNAVIPDEIDVTEPTFGRGFTVGVVVGGVATTVILGLIFLFTTRF